MDLLTQLVDADANLAMAWSCLMLAAHPVSLVDADALRLADAVRQLQAEARGLIDRIVRVPDLSPCVTAEGPAPF